MLFVGPEQKRNQFIQVSPPQAPFVAAVCDVGDVLDIADLQSLDELLVCLEQEVLPAAADPQQIKLVVCRLKFGQQIIKFAFSWHSRAKSTYPPEKLKIA